MTRNQFWTAMSKALTAMTVTLIVTLILATSAAAEYKILYQFRMPKDGANPSGNLIMDAAGSLYGTTWYGGAYGYGTVFKVAPKPDGSWKESVLHSFTLADGAVPRAGVILDAAGNLYGTTIQGGSHNAGVVFKLTPNSDGSWTESVLHIFTGGPDGAYPLGGLTFDAAGNLYGSTIGSPDESEASVFELTQNSGGTWTKRVLHSGFTGDTAGPIGELIFDASGNLYGATDNGGDLSCSGGYGCGEVFKLKPNPDGTWTDSVLHSFTAGADGGYPLAGLMLGAAGILYGTTSGGTNGGGTVFKVDSGGHETVLYSFCSKSNCADGESPEADLIRDAVGNLYGTTAYGGGSGCTGNIGGCGVVFRLTPASSGWTETVLHTFTGYGAAPTGGVIMDSAGTLYGTVSAGSANNGFVFEIMKNCIDHTFVMPYNGTLYLQQKGGSAGATTDFGIGTSPANFVKYYSGLPNNPDPVGEVLVGTFTKGTVINFGMFTQWGSQSGWAFTTGSTQASVVAFSDVDNSLGMGGKILQQTSPTTWLLHLDDAMSYLVDDDDNDVLMQIRIVPQ